MVSIPLVALQFVKYSSITVWVFPIIIIISSLIFSKRTFLIWATVMAIITQRLIWILEPKNMVQLDGYDYMARMRMFIVTASAGIAIYPYDGEDVETLIKNADHAMYKAKEQGKNQHALYKRNWFKN